MTAASAGRSDRIELRATSEEKRLLAAAAAHERLDVTGFILRNVLPAARDIVDRAERIALGRRDTRRVLELLEHPPKPTPALMAAARRRAARKNKRWIGARSRSPGTTTAGASIADRPRSTTI